MHRQDRHNRSSGRPSGLARLFRGQLFRGAGAESGGSAIEFALAAPVLLAMIFGIMDGGRAVFTQAVIHYAAQNAARWAVVHPPASTSPADIAAHEAAIEQEVEDHLILISSSKVATVTAIAAPDPATNTRTISVNVSYDFDWMLPYLGRSGPMTLTASSNGFLAEN